MKTTISIKKRGSKKWKNIKTTNAGEMASHIFNIIASDTPNTLVIYTNEKTMIIKFEKIKAINQRLNKKFLKSLKVLQHEQQK